jgi:hypothetical protein
LCTFCPKVIVVRVLTRTQRRKELSRNNAPTNFQSLSINELYTGSLHANVESISNTILRKVDQWPRKFRVSRRCMRIDD